VLGSFACRVILVRSSCENDTRPRLQAQQELHVRPLSRREIHIAPTSPHFEIADVRVFVFACTREREHVEMFSIPREGPRAQAFNLRLAICLSPLHPCDGLQFVSPERGRERERDMCITKYCRERWIHFYLQRHRARFFIGDPQRDSAIRQRTDPGRQDSDIDSDSARINSEEREQEHPEERARTIVGLFKKIYSYYRERGGQGKGMLRDLPSIDFSQLSM